MRTLSSAVLGERDNEGELSRAASATPPQTQFSSVDPWVLVLAGGDGMRLRELTSAIAGTPMPKQYCRILGGRSLLEATLDRAERLASRERTLVIINRDHLDVARDQLRSVAPDNVLIQPCNRDTGPGLLFALLHLARRDPDATVAVFPSDHYIGDGRGLAPYVEQAVRIVTRLPTKVVILGVHPDRPEPGFGYITPGQPLGGGTMKPAAFRVEAFAEKPTADAARVLLAQGGLWNSFVMVFRVRRMIELLRTVRRRDFDRMRTVCDRPSATPEVYETLDRWNFSSHFLVRIVPNLVVLRVDDLHWNDWGTPESIYHTLKMLNHTPPWMLPAAVRTGSSRTQEMQPLTIQ